MDRAGIEEVANRLGLPMQVVGADVRMACPLADRTHPNRRDRHMSYSVEIAESSQSRTHCFACGARGPLLSVLTTAEAPKAVIELVEQQDRGGLGPAFARMKRRAEPGKPSGNSRYEDSMEDYVARCKGQVSQYVIDRGMRRADIIRWEIGYDEDRKRVVLPVRDHTGRAVGAVRRSVIGAEPKYLATPGLPKNEVFYGEHLIDPTRQEGFLVEGAFDAIMSSRVLPNVLGSLGAKTGMLSGGGGYDPTRLGKLRRWFRRLTVLFDSDKAGRDAFYGWTDYRGRYVPGLRERLRPYMVVRAAWLPDGMDPGSADPETILTAVEGAKLLG